MTETLPTESRTIIKRLKKEGWVEVGHEGSHKHFKHPEIKGKITVISPSRTFARRTLGTIYKMAGWI